ncbi:MAG: hypothetical protein K6G47_13450 [Clostridia bacterium]|nr:hypothetical protein [Clostridia bacterium]
MKKTAVVSLLMALLMLSSCGKTTTTVRTKQDDETIPTASEYTYTEPEPEPACLGGFEVSNSSIFETGYYHTKFEESGNLYFSVTNASDEPANWSIYIVDNELTEDEVKDLQTKEPALVNDGILGITYDQWIYIFCDVNSNTASESTDEILEVWAYADYA